MTSPYRAPGRTSYPPVWGRSWWRFRARLLLKRAWRRLFWPIGREYRMERMTYGEALLLAGLILLELVAILFR